MMENHEANANRHSPRVIRYEEHNRLIKTIRAKLQHIFKQHRVAVNEVPVGDRVLGRSAADVLSSPPAPPDILEPSLQNEFEEFEGEEVGIST